MSADVFALFIKSRVALGLSENTINWYVYMVRRYQEWLAEAGYSWDTVKLLHLQEFQASLRGRYSPATVHQATTAVITFYRWCIEVELLFVDPTVKWRRPHVPDTLQNPVTRDYVRKLLNSIQIYSWIDHRDRLIIRLLFSTGLRLEECASLKLLNVQLPERRLSILGKGKKQRFLPLSPETFLAVDEWIGHIRPKHNTDWLFLSSTAGGRVRGQMRSDSVYWMLKRREEEAGLDWRPPHDFRRGFACDLIELGASTRLVQELLGHSSVQVTERYIRNLSADAVATMFNHVWEEL